MRVTHHHKALTCLPALALLLAFGLPAPTAAGPTAPAAPTAPPPSGSTSPFPSWRNTALIAGGIGLLIALDDEAQDWSQDIRNHDDDELYKTAGHYGEGIVYAPVGVGLFAAGLISGHDGLMHLGGRTSISLLLSGLTTGSLKLIFGRPRPSHKAAAHKFRPFSGRTSFPSGHTAMAFALSTSLALEIDNFWASIVLYSAATAAGLSRVIIDSHWLSDVAAGAAIGHIAARLARAGFWADSDSSPVLLPAEDGVMLGWRWKR